MRSARPRPETDTSASTPAHRDVLPRVVCAFVGVLIGLVLAWRWSDGWLLLLDWAPGPAGGPEISVSLPSGPAMEVVVASISTVSTRAAGWGVVTGGVVLAYFGGVRLARCWRGPDAAPLSWWAATIGGCVAVANPFLVSRVYSGQISVVWGYALLWWLAAALVTAAPRRDARASVVPALWCALAAACSLHLLVIGIVIALLSMLVQGREIGLGAASTRMAAFLSVAVGATAIWLIPSLIDSGSYLGTPGGEAGARLFSSGGPVSTLWARAAGGAAFWRPLPEGSLDGFGVLVGAAWVATIAVGWRFGGGWSRNLRHLLFGCAVLAVAAAYFGRGPTLGPWSWLISTVSPVGLFREPGKFGMLALLLPACGAAAAAQRLISGRASLPSSPARVLGAGAAVVACVGATLWVWSSFAMTLGPSSYPEAWNTAAAAAGADRCAIAVLGDGAYTDPGFTEGRIVANPAEGFFGDRAVISLDPRLDGVEPPRPRTAAGRWSGAINDRYLDGRPVAVDPVDASAAGVGWVFVNRPVDRAELVRALDVSGFEPVVDEAWAGLWRTPGGCR